MPRASLAAVPIGCGLAAAVVLYWYALTLDLAPRAVSFVAFLILAVIGVRAAVTSGDLLNPLSILLALFVLRIAVPAMTVTQPEPPDSRLLADFHVGPQELITGQHLASIGTLAIALGWYATPTAATGLAAGIHRWANRSLRPDPRALPIAVLAFACGIAATILFLALSFGDPLAAAFTGVARNNAAPGTSRYSFLAVGLLIGSSVLVALHQAQAGAGRGRVLLPPIGACLVLTVFGGRVVALTPLALAIIGYHYLRPRDRSRQRLVPRARTVAVAAALTIVALAYVVFVAQYRQGEGVGAVSRALSATTLRSYAEYSLWSEVGALHPYALASRLGPGAMAGSTYPGLLGFPGALVGLDGEQPGNVLVETFGPRGYGRPWGFQTGIVVDVYLNTSLLAALFASLLLGVALRAEYDGFRRAGPALGSTMAHCIAVWTFIWVYFESLLVLPGLVQVILPVLALIVIASRLLPRRNPGSSA
jgi:hypothetical protein